MKRILSAFICILLVFTLVLPQTATAAPSGDQQDGDCAKRTVLLYICGSDLESEFAMATYNLEQIMNARFSADEDVRVVVMTGGSYYWYVDSERLRDPAEIGLSVSEDTDEYTISAEYNQVWEAKGADAPEDPGTLTLLDGDGITGDPGEAVPAEEELMTDPEVLRAFIDYGVSQFPAEKYDLILWDHGGGPLGGFGSDEHEPYYSMSFSDIIDAVSSNLVVDPDGDGEIDSRFDMIDFDACLMSSVELCFALADYTDYYIASPETEPGYGQYYTGWLDLLGEQPDVDAFTLGKQIVDDCYDFYVTGEGAEDDVTLTVFDLQKLVAPETGFVEALTELQQVLRSSVDIKSDSGEYLFYDELASLRDSIHYGDGYNIDLGNFASLLSVASLEDSDEELYPGAGNAYVEASQKLLNILAQSEENDVIYARGTENISSGFMIYRDETGELTIGFMPTSGLYICFPIRSTYGESVPDYFEAMEPVLDQMPDGDRKDFLRAYMETLVDYALIVRTGDAVLTLVNQDDVQKSDLSFEYLREYWSYLAPYYYGDESYTEWNRQVKPLIDLRTGGLSDETIAWLDGVIRQQADEVILYDNVSVDRIIGQYGEEYIVHIDDVNKRVIQSAERDIMAELPALEAFLDTCSESERGYFEYKGRLSIGTVYGQMYTDPAFDPATASDEELSEWENEKHIDWLLSDFEQKWYAVQDADGGLHVAAFDEDETLWVPAYYGTDENPRAAFLGFNYEDEDDEDNAEAVLDTIYFKSADGSFRGTKVKELTGEMTFRTMIYASTYWREYCLPISAEPFTVTKDNYTSIKLVYTDIKNITDISDIDGDGRSFYSEVSVRDIYGNPFDITEKVNEPDRELFDIGLAEISPAAATGETLEPVVECGGRKLTEGVDYTWKKSASGEIEAPGTYTIILIGQDDFTGKAYKRFTVTAPLLGDTDGDGVVTILDVTVIQRELALLPVENYNPFAADTDGDGVVTILDATAIQQYLAGLPSPMNKETLSNDELYARAVRDAMVAQESDLKPLVNITKDDENVIWDGDKVLVLFMHKYPDSYPAGEDLELQWGNVWCVSAGEAYQWVKDNAKGVTDWTERMHQVLGMPTSKEYNTITALWVDADLLYRPANVSDPTAEMQTTYQPTGDEAFDKMFKAWFDSNIIWSYYDSAYPWTRLGYTYDWADNGTPYGLSEFMIFSGEHATVEYTYTIDEFVEYAKTV